MKNNKPMRGKTINIRKINDSVFGGLTYLDDITELRLFKLDESDLECFKEEYKVLDSNCLSEVIAYVCRKSCFYVGVKGESRIVALDKDVALTRIQDGLLRFLHDCKRFTTYDISDVYEEIPFVKREIERSYAWLTIFNVEFCIIDNKYGLCVYFGQDC